MSSKWNPDPKGRKPPPWCRETLGPVIPPIVDGRPQYLIAYLRWLDTDPPWIPNVTASLKLPWNDEDNAWAAHQPGQDYALGGKISRQGETNLFDFELQIWWLGEEFETWDFDDVVMGPEFPWSSKLQEHIGVPGLGEVAMQVYA